MNMQKKPPCCLARRLSLFDRAEIAFSDAAGRADPVFGKIFERRSRSYSGIRITHSWIIFIAADVANILFHDSIIIKFNISYGEVSEYFFLANAI